MADLRVDRASRESGTTDLEGITHLSGPRYGNRWCLTRNEVIDLISEGTHTYFTMVHGRRGDIRVVRGSGGDYLQTFTKGKATDHLLSLKECPVPVAI